MQFLLSPLCLRSGLCVLLQRSKVLRKLRDSIKANGDAVDAMLDYVIKAGLHMFARAQRVAGRGAQIIHSPS